MNNVMNINQIEALEGNNNVLVNIFGGEYAMNVEAQGNGMFVCTMTYVQNALMNDLKNATHPVVIAEIVEKIQNGEVEFKTQNLVLELTAESLVNMQAELHNFKRSRFGGNPESNAFYARTQVKLSEQQLNTLEQIFAIGEGAKFEGRIIRK